MFALIITTTKDEKKVQVLEHYKKILKNSDEALALLDSEYRYLIQNSGHEKLFGFTDDDLREKTPAVHMGNRPFLEMKKEISEKRTYHGELIARTGSGFEKQIELSVFPIFGDEGILNAYLLIHRDITQRIREKERPDPFYLARHDVLTNLPNRRLLDDRLVQALKQADRQGKKLAVLHVDLDHFSKVNESFGAISGDRLLVEIGRRLKKCVRDCDTVSHFLDNTFVILLTESSEIEHTATIAKKILNLISKPILLDKHPVMMSGSIGISLYPEDGSDSQSLLDHAEKAMDRVKLEGRNGYQFHSGDMDAQTLERIELKMAMQRAVERNEFLVHYQPQVNIESGDVFCIEALLRWQHPERGLISPPAFIPMAEATSLILPIGEWVIRTACRQLTLWRENGFPSMRIAVNLSALQFQQESLPDLVREILHETKIDPSALELEITESIMMDPIDKGIETMNRLQNLGVRLAVDDFGIGYSSIGYLRKFPIHTLKVDQSFVKDLCTNSDDAAMTAAIIAMAQNLNLDVIAEGVETKEQMRFLLEHRCNNMQGYYFSRPLPAEALSSFLAEKPCLSH